MTAQLITQLQAGQSIALISDAGTPLVSDPGVRLVQACHQAGVTVSPIPGPSAAICALSAAGLPADRFVFEGFLPAKPSSRQKHLQQLVEETKTLVFYEAPHRIVESVGDLAAILGPTRTVVLARELTKRYETVHHSTLSDLHQWLQADVQQQKGEFVLIVAGAAPKEVNIITSEAAHIFTLLRIELPLKQAAKLASQITGINRNQFYALGLKQEKE
jgi:16S rRNA (cytidine1402-2'-O)-methyltransferase